MSVFFFFLFVLLIHICSCQTGSSSIFANHFIPSEPNQLRIFNEYAFCACFRTHPCVPVQRFTVFYMFMYVCERSEEVSHGDCHATNYVTLCLSFSISFFFFLSFSLSLVLALSLSLSLWVHVLGVISATVITASRGKPIQNGSKHCQQAPNSLHPMGLSFIHILWRSIGVRKKRKAIL